LDFLCELQKAIITIKLLNCMVHWNYTKLGSTFTEPRLC